METPEQRFYFTAGVAPQAEADPVIAGPKSEDDKSPTDGQATMGSSLMNNKEKAEDEARAVDTGRDKAIEYTKRRDDMTGEERTAEIAKTMSSVAEKAGDQYELEELSRRSGKETDKLLEHMRRDSVALLTYGHDIIANQQHYGEPLTANQEAFEAISNFMSKYFSGKNSSDLVTEKLTGKDGLQYSVNYDATKRGMLGFTISKGYYRSSTCEKAETWTVNPWRHDHYGPNDSYVYNKYEVVTHSIEGPDHVTSIVERDLTAEDTNHFKKMLSDFVPAEKAPGQ